MNGAGEGIRTLDIHLGKVVLYQLSYARKEKSCIKINLKNQDNNTSGNKVKWIQNKIVIVFI